MPLFITFLLSFFITPSAYDSLPAEQEELHFEVQKITPRLELSIQELDAANTLVDLDERYKANWVKEYITVEFSGMVGGQKQSVISTDAILSDTQKELITNADLGTKIEVKVTYVPDNNLSYDGPKEMGFSFFRAPDVDAIFSKGEKELRSIIKEEAMDKIPQEAITGYGVAIMTFTINEKGKVDEVTTFQTSGDDKVDAILSETLCNLPGWKPAKYANGQTTSQKFSLIVGSKENCMIHTLNYDMPKN